MKQHKSRPPIRTDIEINLSLDHSFTPVGPDIPGFFPVLSDYGTRVMNPSPSEQFSDPKLIRSQIIEIEESTFGETYTVYVTEKSTGWSGRIPDVPEVDRCNAATKDALLTVLKDKLDEALNARSEAWDKQIEEDIKAGRLDHLREEALEDIRAGRTIDL